MDRIPRRNRHRDPLSANLDDPTLGNGSAAPHKHRVRSLRHSLFRRPTFGGIVFGLVFWWHSIPPTLLPRAWVVQAAVSAISFGIGYAFGTLAGYLGHRLLNRIDRRPSAEVRRLAWRILAVVAILAVIAGIAAWPGWQNEQRDLVTLPHISRLTIVPMLAVTAILTLVFGVLGRLVWRGIRAIDRFTKRHLPFPLAMAATVLIVIVGTSVLVRDVAFEWFVDRANTAFGTVDDSTDEGVFAPTTPLASGGPESLVPWDTLGRQGRNFTAGAVSLDDLARFHGPDIEVTEPIRVYAGLRSADSADARAELALAELERTGAFDRSVLIVATATGTGWIDPYAAEAVEMLHRGDTAMASIQYSYLPSWISFLVDLPVAAEAGTALYETIYERWLELPEDDRPQLVVFGQSLGSYGAEAAFTAADSRSAVNNLIARSDGALFTGPVESNPVWSLLTADRDQGSPVWKPVYDKGETVRFATSIDDVIEPDPGWEGPRILYVHHASDPVGVWNWQTMRARPEWMDQPRGDDVPDGGRWFPVVTFTQVVADLIAGFSAPSGHGHDYTDVFVPAWAQVIPPDGWTSDDSRRLMDFLGRG